MNRSRYTLDSWVSLSVSVVVAVSVVSAGYALRQYYALWRLAEAGARYAAVHGAASDPRFMRPRGTTTAVRDYLLRQSADPRLIVAVSPADPNTLAPGAFITVTVARPLAPQWSSGLHNLITLRSSSSTTVVN